MADYDLGNIQGSGATGLDALFEREDHILSPQHKTASRIKIASLKDLEGFTRLSSETLVHKSERDLWALRKEGDQYFVERLFDDQGEPIRG